MLIFVATAVAFFLVLTYAAWRRYLWAGEKVPQADTCPYSLTDVFDDRQFLNVPHQKGIRWLTEVFSRSAEKFPHLTALADSATSESPLTFAELDARAENVAAALSPYLTGPDQVVAVAMSQDNWQIVASHLGILKAGGTVLFLDTTLPEALVTHMLNDAQPVVIVTRGQDKFRDLPTLDVMTLPERMPRREPPTWLDDPTQRLATIFYTSGTTGKPKGVECPHAGYVNLALSYADYFDLMPGMDATSLTSSLGYDGSISEMYGAWVSGCAVVMLTKEQIRSGPDLVAVLREAEVTVLFCPAGAASPPSHQPQRWICPIHCAASSCRRAKSSQARSWSPGPGVDGRSSTPTAPQRRAPTPAARVCGRGSPSPSDRRSPTSPTSSSRLMNCAQYLTERLESSASVACTLRAGTATCRSSRPKSSSRILSSAASTAPAINAKSTFKRSAYTSSAEIDAQLKVRGHRVEAQAVEGILQTQFSEIEAAVVDYQNEALVAFVAAPSVCEGEISVVAQAPAAWAARVTAALAKQLPEPSVPTRILLVEKFVMNPISGKIDRKSLPNLSHLRRSAEPKAEDARRETLVSARDTGEGEVEPPDADAGMDPENEEVLAICRAVFETQLGLDDGFVEAGAHSILIARLAQQLQASGWEVTVRALLSDCNTARKVARRPRALRRTSKVAAGPVRCCEDSVEHDQVAAEVLPVGYFTALQVLFAIFLYSPGLVVVLVALDLADVGTFFTTATLWEFIIVGLFLYLLGLVTPFAGLLWVMTIKFFMGGDIYKNNVTPGVYPKWSRMHLRIWCIGRLENMVLLTLRTLYRSAALMAFVLRQLGASVGDNVQCAHDAQLSGPLDLISIDDNVAIQTGAYIQATSWSGQSLHVGPVRLASGCKIGMRAAIANNVTVGPGSWITPFTPILASVGSHEMWEGAPARLSGRCTELRRTARYCQYASPIWLLEALNIAMQIFISFWLIVVPTAAILWFASGLIPAADAELSGDYFRVTPLWEILWHLSLYAFITTGLTLTVTALLECLFIRCTAASPGLYPSRGFRAALLMYRKYLMDRIQRQWTWTITGQYLRALAGMRFPRVGASECDLMFNLVPELASADSQVFWSNGCFTNMLDYGAEHIKLRQLDMPRNFFSGNNCVAEYGHFPSNFLVGVSTAASDIQFRRQMRSRPGEPITVAGNPAVKFASASFEAANKTQRRPDFPLFLTRIFLFDFFTIGILPITEGLIFAILYICLLRAGIHPLAIAAIALLFTEVSLVLICIATKKSLVGSKWGADDLAPFWSWRHFAYFFVQDCFFVWCRGALWFCAGTILSNSILRWMGCQIGDRTVLVQPMQCSDWNAVAFGNDCVVDGVLQLHTFENMVLKVKRTRVEDGCTVCFGATVMGGAVIERGTTLLPLSLVLKEMHLPTAIYEGSPVEPASVTR